jgi:hypothetical protein
MGGAHLTWRLVRHVFLLMTVAALGALAIAPAVAATGEPAGAAGVAGGETVHRLALVPEAANPAGSDSTFTATLERSGDGGDTWRPAAGEEMSFAYVTDGAGLVTAVNGGPIGSMTCAADRAGHCTITVRSELPGDSVVAVSAGVLRASARVG